MHVILKKEFSKCPYKYIHNFFVHKDFFAIFESN